MLTISESVNSEEALFKSLVILAFSSGSILAKVTSGILVSNL